MTRAKPSYDNFELDDISDLFRTDCSNMHLQCKKINEALINYIDRQQKVTGSFIDKYFKHCMRGTLQTYSNHRCLYTERTFVDVFKKLVDNNFITDTNLMTLVLSLYSEGTSYYYKSYSYRAPYDNNDGPDDNIIKMFTHLSDVYRGRNKKISSALLTTILKHSKLHSIANILFDNCEINNDVFMALCDTDNSELLEKTLKFKLPITSKHLNATISHGNKKGFDMLLSDGADVDILCLETACLQRNEYMIKRLLDFKLMPTEKCIQSLLTNVAPSNTHNSNGKGSADAISIAKLIDLLVDAGYNVKYKDVVNALHVRCYINNIERFGIKFTGEFLEECADVGYYPYDLKDVKVTLGCLQKECKKGGNLTTIRRLISTMKIKPDIVCLRNACNIKNNKQTIDYLLKNGLEPDVICLQNIASVIGNSTLNCIVNHIKSIDCSSVFIKVDNETKEDYDAVMDDDELEKEDKINELIMRHNGEFTDSEINSISNYEMPRVKSVMITKKVPESNINKDTFPAIPIAFEIDKPTPVRMAMRKQPKASMKKTKYIKEDDIDADDDIDNKIDEELNKTKKASTKSKENKKLEKIAKKKNITIVDDIDEVDKVEVGDENIADSNETVSVQVKSIVDKKKKQVIKADVIAMMKLNKTDNTMTFTDMRKKMLEYIKTNNLIDAEKKDIIVANNELSNVLALKNKSRINFSDLDNVVSNCFE